MLRTFVPVSTSRLNEFIRTGLCHVNPEKGLCAASELTYTFFSFIELAHIITDLTLLLPLLQERERYFLPKPGITSSTLSLISSFNNNSNTLLFNNTSKFLNDCLTPSPLGRMGGVLYLPHLLLFFNQQLWNLCCNFKSIFQHLIFCIIN